MKKRSILIPLREYVENIARLTKIRSELLYGAVAYPPTGMVSTLSDVPKLKRERNWEPNVPFGEGIHSILRAITKERQP